MTTFYKMRGRDADCASLTYREWTVSSTPDYQALKYTGPKCGGSALADVTVSSQFSDGSGAILPFVAPPKLADLTWVNQDVATARDEVDGLLFQTPGDGVSISRKLLVKAAPTTPYTFTVGMYLHLWPAPSPTVAGLVFRESGTGKFVEFVVYFSANSIHMETDKFTSPTIGASVYDDGGVQPAVSPTSLFYMRVVDDGTNLNWYWSYDGKTFLQWVPSRGRTDFLAGGPDQIGVTIQSASATAAHQVKMKIVHWEVK